MSDGLPYLSDPNSDDPSWLGEPARCKLPEECWPELAARLNLTDRELAVVQGLFEGQKEEPIAKSLGISAHTVHTHLVRVYRKLNVRNRAELLLRVFSSYMRQEAILA